MMEWKDRGGWKCVFRVGLHCRRFPPSRRPIPKDAEEQDDRYPRVNAMTPACAEYQAEYTPDNEGE